MKFENLIRWEIINNAIYLTQPKRQRKVINSRLVHSQCCFRNTTFFFSFLFEFQLQWCNTREWQTDKNKQSLWYFHYYFSVVVVCVCVCSLYFWMRQKVKQKQKDITFYQQNIKTNVYFEHFFSKREEKRKPSSFNTMMWVSILHPHLNIYY